MMDSDRLILGALLFLGLIIGANLLMYAIARGATRGGDVHWMSTLRNALSKPTDNPANQSMDELRQRMEELGEKKKEE